jgi:hypothetical protein
MIVAAKPFAFVLMPFDDEFEDIYKLGIKSVANESGVIAERVDEQSFSDTILDRIYKQIDAADFIIADMTGRNPNVFYEVGYAHAKEKLCTLLTQSPEDIPFDLKHHRHVIYGGSISTLKEKLSKEIEWLKAESEKTKTIPFSIELKSSYGDLIKSSFAAYSHVDLVFDIRNKTKKKSPDVDAIYIYTNEDWTFYQDDKECGNEKIVDGIYRRRHFVKSPVLRVLPGGWAQFKVQARKRVWTSWGKEELKDSYIHEGSLKVEIQTAEQPFSELVHLKVEADEIPF